MFTGGQSFVSAPPTFSNDGKKLLVCTGFTVSIFSTSTGMQIAELEGHTDRVTSIVVVPVAAPASKFMDYCWTSSLDGMICYWDFSVPELIKKVKVELPIFSMVIPNISNASIGSGNKSSTLYAFVSVEDKTKPDDQHKALRGQIRIYNLTSSRRVGGLLAETRNPEHIIVSRSGEFIGIKNKRKLHVWRIPEDFKPDEIKKIKLHHTKNLSALAFHPTERMVAGGDVTGRILIWRGFGMKKFTETLRESRGRPKLDEDRPGVRGNDDADSCSTWHWHPSEIKFLLFSSDGAYLYSGGQEGVIVVWQLDTGKRKYKPRLGSPLLYFVDSPDPSLSCVSCADNQIHILKMPTMEITKSIAGIKLPFSFPDVYDGLHKEFAYDQSNGLIALRTEDYCVQFFSLFDNSEVSQVQVCERNFQPVDDPTVCVALVALSSDGFLMCTVDVKLPEERLGSLVSLKFWTRGLRVGEYSLSTVIYEPHSDAGISAVCFHPGQSMAVSSSFGGDFKVWVHSSVSRLRDQKHEKAGWRCQSVGSYKRKPMTAAAFSADGSVLAVAAETVITLWDPDTNILVAVIGEALSPISKLSFVGKSEYLVSLSRSSKPQVALWNTSNLSMYWSYKLFAEAVCCAGNAPQFAILALSSSQNDIAVRDQEGIILLFDVENPVPLTTWLVKKAKGGGLAFVTKDQSLLVNGYEDNARGEPSLLAYINSDHEYIVFDPHNEDGRIGKSARRSQAPPEEAVPIGYTSIYGELPKIESNKGTDWDIPFVPSERPWETIFSGSSHVLPPLTKLCSTFLASLLEKRPPIADES
ncbi:WD repeat-containing protein 75 [Ananas comosus]|uniref:WD repeat-containing protein 75 n=1 Tax=Ananas comosus TaxID=4615 RepID=A0A199UJ97_ANACO|nr:WD repeat-containing protein 75 [Ananas comosus]OAY64962.1 WD repeat-containing protein 75 [Ananas comosus]